MHRIFSALVAAASLSIPLTSRAAAPETTAPAPGPTSPNNGDLFPVPWRLSTAAATGLPFVGIAEVGVGVTNGFAIGVIGGITPSVLTAGIRPRFRVKVTDHFAFLLNSPMLWYPKASAPGPGNIQNASWVLARPELFADVSVTDRLHLGGGMGIIAAGSVEAIDNKLRGNDFAVPAYAGASDTKKGFAGGIWNTIATHSSYALTERTQVFLEGSLVLSGIALADDVGGPPIVVNLGLQHTF